MPTIRTVFQPDSPREVDEAEFLQLQREGLLIEDEPQPQPEAAPKPGATVTAGPAVPAPTPAPREVSTDGGK